MTDDEKVLSWLTSQDVLEIKDEIEEVNRKMLDKLLDENDFVAVYFCKHQAVSRILTSDYGKAAPPWHLLNGTVIQRGAHFLIVVIFSCS